MIGFMPILCGSEEEAGGIFDDKGVGVVVFGLEVAPIEEIIPLFDSTKTHSLRSLLHLAQGGSCGSSTLPRSHLTFLVRQFRHAT